MDGGAWWATVHGVPKSWTRLSDFTYLVTQWAHQFWCPPKYLKEQRAYLPPVISKGLSLSPVLDAALILRRAVGKSFVHGSGVSWQSLARVLLKVWFAFSTFPDDWGLQAVWRWGQMPRAGETSWVTRATKKGLWPLCKDHGSLNWGIISLSDAFITSGAPSVLVGKASSTHPGEVRGHQWLTGGHWVHLLGEICHQPWDWSHLRGKNSQG